MRLRTQVRAVPALFRIGFASAVAYRAELIVWILSTTMPLIMLALFSTVAADAPLGRFGVAQFTAYFLGTFIVRQLTGSWIAWQMNFEIRQGTLSMRLLRPLHPLVGYGIEALAATPVRCIVALPLACLTIFFAGKNAYTHDASLWGLWLLSLLGAWLLTLLTNFSIGLLALYMKSSVKLLDIWLALYFVFGGYVVPVELFPRWMRVLTACLPFRYQLALPVELMTGSLGVRQALLLLGGQWAGVLLSLLLCIWLWRRGIRQFEAFGG